MDDHDIGWTRQGRDSDECTGASRDALSVRGLGLGIVIAVAIWTAIAWVVTA